MTEWPGAVSWVVTSDACDAVRIYRGVASGADHARVLGACHPARLRVLVRPSEEAWALPTPVLGLYAVRDPALVEVSAIEGGQELLKRLTLRIGEGLHATPAGGGGEASAFGPGGERLTPLRPQLVEFLATVGLPVELEETFFDLVAPEAFRGYVRKLAQLLRLDGGESHG